MGYFSETDITEAEAITDYGEFADELLEEYEIERIEHDRALRLHRLAGKYVIVQDARYGGSIQYLQDQTIDKSFRGHYWTGYLSNAKGFVDLSAARIKCGNLKYNNPRVMMVTNDLKVRPISMGGTNDGK